MFNRSFGCKPSPDWLRVCFVPVFLAVAVAMLASTALAQTSAQRYLRITEIMYNPAGAPAINSDAQQFEFIELKNVSTATNISLANISFTAGVTFNFSTGVVTVLPPGALVLVVRNAAAFTALYGSGLPIAGQFTGALNNGGETLRLEEAGVGVILDFAFANTWVASTDGGGFSLVIVDPLAAASTWGLGSSWRASSHLNGSPGQNDPLPTTAQPVRVNEILSNPTGTDVDYIELVNLAATNVVIGGWYLTDDHQTPKKYRIPAGTVLPPYGYLAIGEGEFGGGAGGFGLSALGEDAYIYEADAAGTLTGFYHGFAFGGSPRGMSFGRYVNSQGEEDLVLQSARTPGGSNAAPSVGPIVFSEVMYNPTGTLEEFIELENIASEPVALYCTYTNESGYGASALTNTWRIHGGVDFDFPQGKVLPAGGLLVVVGFDPATNATLTAGVRAQYGIPAAVQLLGPYSGKLSNSGETLNLYSPDRPAISGTNITVPYVPREKLAYSPTAPWPTSADGGGASLQRQDRRAYGNDPTNWFGASPTAGLPNTLIPPIILQVAVNRSNTIVTATAVPGLTYTLQYRTDFGSGMWTGLAPAVTATGHTVSLTNSEAPVPRRFYRVRPRY